MQQENTNHAMTMENAKVSQASTGMTAIGMMKIVRITTDAQTLFAPTQLILLSLNLPDATNTHLSPRMNALTKTITMRFMLATSMEHAKE